MASDWERNGLVEIDVEERPSRQASAAVRRSSAIRSIERTQWAARGVRIAAVVIAGASVLSGLLTTFWLDAGDNFYPGGLRMRIGYMLQSVTTPLALAALVFGLSLVVTVYAARVELERPPDGDAAFEPASSPPLR